MWKENFSFNRVPLRRCCHKKSGLLIRIRIRIQIADPDPDPGEQQLSTKLDTITEFACFEVLDVLFWGLKASPVAGASYQESKN